MYRKGGGIDYRIYTDRWREIHLGGMWWYRWYWYTY